jgi:hypothetical protein
MCAPRVTRHTSIWYSSFYHTRTYVRPTNARWPRCSSEEYRYTHVDACVVRNWTSYRCVLCHPWYTHLTSLVVKKNFFSFPVAVNNSIKVGPLVFLLYVFVITENIMERPYKSEQPNSNTSLFEWLSALQHETTTTKKQIHTGRL